MNPLASAVLITWKRNASYGLRLLEGVTPSQMIAQPVAGRAINHPAWILSHLVLYGEIAVRLSRAEGFADPAEHRYGQKSEPVADASEYESKEALVAAWSRIHEAGEASLAACGVEITSRPNPLERWRGVNPTIGDMLVTLMVKHEAGHLGQLSTWRRAIGMARVPV